MKSTSHELEWFICWYCRKYFLDGQKLEEHNFDHHGNQDNSQTVQDTRSMDDHVEDEFWEHPAIAESSPWTASSKDMEVTCFGTNYEAKSITAPVNATLQTSLTKLYTIRKSNGQNYEEKSCKSKCLVSNSRLEDEAESAARQSKIVASSVSLILLVKPASRRMNSSASTCGIQPSISDRPSKKTMDLKSLGCDFGDKKFCYPSQLQEHIPTHAGEKAFRCGICEYASAAEYNLKSHMLVHANEKPFSCHVCEYTSTLKSSLKRHMLVHTNEKPFRCHVCEYASARKHDLKIHLMTHTKEKPFPCKICGKPFRQRYTLKVHMRVHTKEKPFPCKICGKPFRERGTLRYHMMTHTKEKPFPCKICGKHFRERGTLRYHMTTHTKEKPFPCKICGKPFRQRGALRVHMSIHTKEKPFPLTPYSCNDEKLHREYPW